MAWSAEFDVPRQPCHVATLAAVKYCTVSAARNKRHAPYFANFVRLGSFHGPDWQAEQGQRDYATASNETSSRNVHASRQCCKLVAARSPADISSDVNETLASRAKISVIIRSDHKVRPSMR